MITPVNSFNLLPPEMPGTGEGAECSGHEETVYPDWLPVEGLKGLTEVFCL